MKKNAKEQKYAINRVASVAFALLVNVFLIPYVFIFAWDSHYELGKSGLHALELIGLIAGFVLPWVICAVVFQKNPVSPRKPGPNDWQRP